MQRLHLDTDIGSDPDDACALTMLLGWPGVEVVGITTTDDPHGLRAGYVELLLRMLGRDDIPVAAGAGGSLTTGRAMGDIPDHATYWGDVVVTPRPGPLDRALDLIDENILDDATVVAIGPYTNLAAFDRRSRGGLAAASVVAMGGWVRPFDAGLPPWGPDRDWNVQCDTEAARALVETADVTLVTLGGAAKATLRERDLAELAATGAVGELLARQSRAHGLAQGYDRLGPSYDGLPDDLVNFHWDPVACAVAAGWPGAERQTLQLSPVVESGVMRFAEDPDGVEVQVVTDLLGTQFREVWLEAVSDAQVLAQQRQS